MCLLWGSSSISFNELAFGLEKKEIITLETKLPVFSEALSLLATASNVLSVPRSLCVASCNSASLVRRSGRTGGDVPSALCLWRSPGE